MKMMSSSQYQMPCAVISIGQDENLQEKCDDHNNRFKQQQQQQQLKQQSQNIGLNNARNIKLSSKSKVTIAYENINDDQHGDDGEMLKRVASSVLVYPPSDADGKSFSSEKSRRHILKIQISPEAKKLPSSSGASRMSVVSSGGRSAKDAIYSNVTIIGHRRESEVGQCREVKVHAKDKNKNEEVEEEEEDEVCDFEEENLSDDQKLVLNVSRKGDHVICASVGGGGVRVSVNGMEGGGSGQCSPCGGDDHLDSGTCSDVETSNSLVLPPPPPLPPKGIKGKRKQKLSIKLSESTCSDVSSASSSSDSMQYQLISPDLIRSIGAANGSGGNSAGKSVTIIGEDESDSGVIVGLLPRSLLHDIRTHSMKAFLRSELEYASSSSSSEGEELSYSDIVICATEPSPPPPQERQSPPPPPPQQQQQFFDDDKYFTRFHINETFSSLDDPQQHASLHEESDESFAGYKDLRCSTTSTIRSAKGTIRGVKNRVRNGIATFLQMQQTTVKNFKEKDGGKIVLYTTSMGVVRSTYAKCQAVKQILRTLMVKFEERDVFMSYNHQQEIRERMQNDDIDVPQLFVEGQYIGNADQVERLNETGELRMMLKPYKCRDSLMTCNICGGYKMLPCPSCGGSKKSIHRNHFTAEFIALKCMNCDEVGLVKCYNCA